MIRHSILFVLLNGWLCAGQLRAQNDTALGLATSFVRSNISDLQADEFILLDYVQRRFNLAFIDNKLRQGYLDKWFRKDSSQTLLYQFRRLLIPSAHKVDFSLVSHPIDSVSLMALDCSTWNDPGLFKSKLKQHKEEGGYYLTHGLLALQWALENKCLDADEEEVANLLKELQNANLNFIQNSTAPQDEKFEAICMLYYSGYDRDSLNDFIKVVQESQLKTGGWASSERSEIPSMHTTAFALWILLEVQNEPNAKSLLWTFP